MRRRRQRSPRTLAPAPARELAHLRIFLCYRRDDASGHAGRLYDMLADRYGADRVFMDVDAIPLGGETQYAVAGRSVGRYFCRLDSDRHPLIIARDRRTTV